MATIPRTFQKKLAASSSGEDAILLVTFINAAWASNRRYCSHGPEMKIVDGQPLYGVTASTLWYDHAVMSVVFADDSEGELPSIPLEFENVATDVGTLADEIIENISVDLVVAAASNTAQILGEVRGLNLISADASDERISLEVGYATTASEPYPAWRMVKNNVPGIFR